MINNKYPASLILLARVLICMDIMIGAYSKHST